MNPDTLPDLIIARYEMLSASERRVADLLLGSPHLMNGFTATELAASAGVSKATITRFIDKLGLADFGEFRRAARDRAAFPQGSPLDLMDQELATTQGDLRRLVAETLRGDLANLNQTYTELSFPDVAEVVKLLSEDGRLIFADFRKQFALAYYAATLFRVIRPNVSTLPIPGASAVDGMLDVGEGDLLVMFPFRRPERDQDILSRSTVDAGATLVTIGDIWPNPANRRARIHLTCKTESAGVFDSFVSPISVINLLFTATANRLGDQATERLATLEDKHDEFETFLTGDNSPRHRGGSK